MNLPSPEDFNVLSSSGNPVVHTGYEQPVLFPQQGTQLHYEYMGWKSQSYKSSL